jgi:hypothetical protein
VEKRWIVANKPSFHWALQLCGERFHGEGISDFYLQAGSGIKPVYVGLRGRKRWWTPCIIDKVAHWSCERLFVPLSILFVSERRLSSRVCWFGFFISEFNYCQTPVKGTLLTTSIPPLDDHDFLNTNGRKS